MRVIRRGSTRALRDALDRARSSEPTWTGGLALPPPAGFNADQVSRSLGSGDEVFAAAADRILSWGVQRRSGLVVQPDAERAAVGTTFVVGLPFGPAWVLAPCRVVDVTATSQRSGFTFVTLVGHPERGIEEFAVVRSESGAVSFEIRAISRPMSRLAQLGKPVTRQIQVRQTSRYLEAVSASR